MLVGLFVSKKQKYYIHIILIICLIFEAYKTYKYFENNSISSIEHFTNKLFPKKTYTLLPLGGGPIFEITNWIRENTNKSDVILSDIGISPMILTYTDRPVNLHPKFESKDIRDKYEEFVMSLYDKEQKFYEVCNKFKTDYFIYDYRMVLDTSKDSKRYIANALSLPKNAVVYEFNFAPERLKHFELVYQNITFRIFKVLKENEKNQHHQFPYQPFFDIKLFENYGSVNNSEFNDKNNESVLDRIYYAKTSIDFIRNLRTQGNYKKAFIMLDEIKQYIPNYEEIYTETGQLLYDINMLDKAIEAYKKAIEINPYSVTSYIEISSLYFLKKEYDLAIKMAERAIKISPNPYAYNNLGGAYYGKGLYTEALRSYKKAIEMNPSWVKDIQQNYSNVLNIMSK